MSTQKAQILQIESLSSKDLEDTRKRLVGIANSNTESITLLIDKARNGDYNSIIRLAETLKVTNCNISVSAQGDLDLSGFLAISSLKYKKGRRNFSNYYQTDLSKDTNIDKEVLERVSKYISNNSKAEKAEITEWIRKGSKIDAQTMLEKKLVDNIGAKRKRIVKIQADKSATNQSAVAVEKENVKNIIK